MWKTGPYSRTDPDSARAAPARVVGWLPGSAAETDFHPARMLSYQFYNLVHIVGLIFLMAALGGIASTTVGADDRFSRLRRRAITIFHAVGLFLILLGGFGLLARLGVMHGAGFPGWIWVKLGIWVILGVAAFIPYRYPRTALPLLMLLPVLGGLAAYMAIYKPL
jgi:hypothetical protein